LSPRRPFGHFRYFASEGFLPGYSFPRLPLAADVAVVRGKPDEGTCGFVPTSSPGCAARERLTLTQAALRSAVPPPRRASLMTWAGEVFDTALAVKSFGSESRMTFLHADATCLGRDPPV
jgi:hypothetical protein